MNNILLNVQKELDQNADKHTKNTAQRFFKEKVKFYGVKTAIVTKISEKYFDTIKEMNKEEVFQLCERLLKSGCMEESFIACNWSYYIHEKFEEKDFTIFEKWLEKYINNWASCDTLCNHTIGAFIERFPEYARNLKEWAISDNKWMRRAAAVSLIVPAKEGKFLKQAEINVHSLLQERHLRPGIHNPRI